MHILLTDILTCPRCGPTVGLIVIADQIADRRILTGFLGCPNCQSQYPIADGVADMRISAEEAFQLSDSIESISIEDRAIRAAALVGVPPPASTVLVLEPAGTHASRISDLFSKAHTVSGTAKAETADEPEEGTLSRVILGESLPFYGGKFSGVIVLGSPSPNLLLSIARLVAPGNRIVVDDSSEGLSDVLKNEGLEVLLEQDSVMVAVAPKRG